MAAISCADCRTPEQKALQIDPRDLNGTAAVQNALGNSKIDRRALAELYAGATPPVDFKRPGGAKILLTYAVQDRICELIASGAWDYIAAEAAGISQNSFYKYLERFPVFKRNVEAAKAQARADAEKRVREMDPAKWLRYGLGKDRPGRPGWTGKDDSSGNAVTADITVWKCLDTLTADELVELKRLVEKARGPIEKVIEGKVLTSAALPAKSDTVDAQYEALPDRKG